jgi:ribonuclease P protein component
MIKLWERLSSKEFQVMFTSGKFSGNRLSILVKPNYLDSRVGFTIKKGKRNSVVRNYYKRLLREAFIDVQQFIPENWSIVLIVNPGKGVLKLDQLRFELLQLIDCAKGTFIGRNENNFLVSH